MDHSIKPILQESFKAVISDVKVSLQQVKDDFSSRL